MNKYKIIDKLKVEIFGYSYLRTEIPEGFNLPTDIYLGKCSIHGYQESVFRGYVTWNIEGCYVRNYMYIHPDGRYLECPICRKEFLKKLKK